MSRKRTPWFSLVAGIATTLTILLLVFSNIAAFGKSQARTEQVEEDVAGLKEKTDEQEDELWDMKSDQKLVAKDLEVIRNNMTEQKIMIQQVFEAVSKKR